MLTTSYSAFTDNLRLKTKQSGAGPLTVLFELTYRCNYSCQYCYQGVSKDVPDVLQTNDVFYLLDVLHDNGCLSVCFTGGEPFMRDDCMSILRYAKKKGFITSLLTNASCITPEIACELTQLSLQKIDISLHSLHEATFNTITRTTGYFSRVYTAIDCLARYNAPIAFKATLIERNHAEKQAFQTFADNYHAFIRFAEVILPISNDPQLCCLPEKRRNNESFQKPLPDIFPCDAGITQAAITAQGSLRICHLIDHFDIPLTFPSRTPSAHHAEFSGAWQQLQDSFHGQSIDNAFECSSCAYEYWCTWCPAMAWWYNRSFTSCYPRMKAWAKQKAVETKTITDTL